MVEHLAPRDSRWTARVFLLVPALTQLGVAYLLFQELSQNSHAAAPPVLLTLLALVGAGGIMAGIFGRSRRLFRVGILCALLGFAVPATIHFVSSAVDKDTSLIASLGHYDAESLETLVFVRMLIELPSGDSTSSYLASRAYDRVRNTPCQKARSFRWGVV